MRLTPFANLHINAFSGAGITELEAGITNGMVDKKGDVFYLTQRPSIDVFEDASAKGGGNRGRGLFYWDETSALYLVNNDKLYKSSHSNALTHSDASTVTAGTTRVYFFVLADTLIVVNPEGNEAFNITAADAVTEITSTNFPPYFTSGAVQLAHGGAVLNQKLYVMDVNGVIYNSNSVSETATNPGKTWGPLDFIDAEREEDGGVYLGKHHDHIVAYGVSTIEFFYDAGNATGSPLNRRADVAYQIGCSTGESVWEEGDRAFFISVDFSGTLSVSTLENFSIRKISNSTLESYLTTAITRSGYSAVGSGFSARGHTFYTLTIYRVSTDIVPEITFVYDDTAGMWYHEWDTTIIPTAGTLTYNNKSFDITSEDSSPTGLTFSPDGLKMFTSGRTNDSVYQYTLSTAFDVSTATYASKSFDVTGQENSIRSVTFSPEGLKMFIIGVSSVPAGDEIVFQYALSTAFDVTTATYASKSFTVSEDTSPYQLFFKSDGLKMYIVGSSNDTIYQYTLSTAFDVSTASYDSKSFTFSEDASPFGAALSSDGADLYMAGNTNDAIFHYTLGTAYDISTAVYSSTSFDISTETTGARNLFVNSDGDKLFVLSAVTLDIVFEYDLTGINDSSKFPLIGWTKRRGSIERFGEGMFANGDMITITDNLLPQDTLLASGWVADGWVQTGWVSNTAGGTVGITMKSRIGMFDGGTDIHKYPKAYRQVSDESSSDMTLRWANENNTSFSTGKTLTAGYSKSTRNGRFRRRNHEIEFSGSEAKRIEAIEVDF